MIGRTGYAIRQQPVYLYAREVHRSGISDGVEFLRVKACGHQTAPTNIIIQTPLIPINDAVLELVCCLGTYLV